MHTFVLLLKLQQWFVLQRSPKEGVEIWSGVTVMGTLAIGSQMELSFRTSGKPRDVSLQFE